MVVNWNGLALFCEVRKMSRWSKTIGDTGVERAIAAMC